ncbi:MAG: MoaD/ThiS family protein [Planctomycetaceae bacterium]|nr:MoaD/ThiS family protein [Planctomycetaceae bacterium]
MANVTFHLEAQLRHLAQADQTTLELPEGASLIEGLQQLASKQPELAKYLVDADNNVQRSLLIVLNNQPVVPSDAAKHALNDGAEVVLLPPISGG